MARPKKTQVVEQPPFPSMPQEASTKGHIAFNINPVLKNWLNMVCQAEGATQGELIERALRQYARSYDLDAKLAEMRRQIAAI